MIRRRRATAGDAVLSPVARQDGQDPLADLFREAVDGRFPAQDGTVEVWPSPGGPADAVVAFTAHHVVAAPVDIGWVLSQLPADDLGAPMRATFLNRLGEHLGARPESLDVVLAARATAQPIGVELEPAGDDIIHPRLDRGRRYRSGLRCLQDRYGSLLMLGNGLAGRVEVSVEVNNWARGRGLGTALAAAALGLLPPGEPVFAQVSPGNTASLRCFLAAGYCPIGAEVLFLRQEPNSHMLRHG